MKLKSNSAIELQASDVTHGFDLGHDLDLEFSRSIMEFAISIYTQIGPIATKRNANISIEH